MIVLSSPARSRQSRAHDELKRSRVEHQLVVAAVVVLQEVARSVAVAVARPPPRRCHCRPQKTATRKGDHLQHKLKTPLTPQCRRA